MEGMSGEGVNMGNFDPMGTIDWQSYLEEFLNQHDPSTGIYRIRELCPADEEWLATCLADADLVLEDFGAERLVFRSPLEGLRITAVFHSNAWDGGWVVQSVKRIPDEHMTKKEG